MGLPHGLVRLRRFLKIKRVTGTLLSMDPPTVSVEHIEATQAISRPLIVDACVIAYIGLLFRMT